ncbi:tellurite resistance TerB family protein [Vibrio methylphosphonaticus]|uniref:tellurite resistance TerB family protein n=1 Tax=Vibrio methylphosphonaticus TaxID=2946866 RepID=UPI00202A1AE5|nr:TerB family tellurite resistance protein [Vibrio methylphosphonaticus]MCL9777365.1 TerB family tellurite resistance protein [Vibrio methylphosphonaticus]
MFTSITSIFKQLIEGSDLSQNQTVSPNLAIASLLCEVSNADHQIDEKEEQAKRSLISRLLKLSDEETNSLIEQAKLRVEESVSLYDFTSGLRELSQEKRFELITAMWEVANADGVIDPQEDAVIRKVAELLYVDHSEFIRAKIQVIDK